MKNPYKAKDKIKFMGEKLPYTVMATSDRFTIASRKLDKTEDRSLLEYQAEMRAYLSLKEAYQELKNSPVYTIVDLHNGIRGKDNLVSGVCDYFNEADCLTAIKMLESGEMEISRRGMIRLNIDLTPDS